MVKNALQYQYIEKKSPISFLIFLLLNSTHVTVSSLFHSTLFHFLVMLYFLSLSSGQVHWRGRGGQTVRPSRVQARVPPYNTN